MKSIKFLLRSFILLLVFSLSNSFYFTKVYNFSYNEVTGDYLFDYKNMNLVCLITIYEENGDLYAFPEFSDYPLKMETLNAQNREFRITFKCSNCYDLKFLDKIGGSFSKLVYSNKDNTLELIGNRISGDAAELRAYQPNKSIDYKYQNND